MTDTAAAPAVSKPLVIALSVLGGLVALFTLWTFVVSPLLAEEEVIPLGAAPVPDQEAVAVQDVADELLDEEQDDPLPETFEVFSARDPFQQLVSPPVIAAAPDGDGAAGGGGADPADPADPSTPATPVVNPAPVENDDPTGLPGARVGTTVVRILDVATTDGVTRASITVNGTGYQVAEGETFAESFRVLDLSGTCATLLFGDSRFTLCAGDEIRK